MGGNLWEAICGRQSVGGELKSSELSTLTGTYENVSITRVTSPWGAIPHLSPYPPSNPNVSRPLGPRFQTPRSSFPDP